MAEALRADVPANALYVAIGIESDERITEAIKAAGDRGLSLLEVSRSELDRMTGGLLHQGIALQVPPFKYTELDELLARAAAAKTYTPLLVALDGVTDPRNLGAVIRSAVAFGAQGVIVPERRAAGVTAAAWRTSAGNAARIPIAQVTNLTRSIKAAQKAGLFVVGLDANAETDIYEMTNALDPLRRGGRFGRRRPVAAGQRQLRRTGAHSDGGRGRITERVGRRRGDLGRDRPPARVQLRR